MIESSACSRSDSSLDCNPSPAKQLLSPQSVLEPAHIASVPDENRTLAAGSPPSPIPPALRYRLCSLSPDDRSLPRAAGSPAVPRPYAIETQHAFAAPNHTPATHDGIAWPV